MSVIAPLRPDAIVDYQDEQVAVIRHDARTLPLDDGVVDLIVTSPPYFALRSYRDDGEHYDGQIGSEDTPEEYLQRLDECMVEWGRVLKPSGSIWINLGDKYAGSGGHNNSNIGADPARGPSSYNKEANAPAKSLMGLPWRFAIRQIDAGWILRAEVVWDKPNGLPESVTDRVRRSHEQWFHFVREPRYFAGIDEIREPQTYPDDTGRINHRGAARREADGMARYLSKDRILDPLGRVPGSVWSIPSEPLLIPDDTRQLLDLPDHFAAFPQEWPRRIITGWSPTGICTVCGEGRRPEVEKELVRVWHDKPPQATRYEDRLAEHGNNRKVVGEQMMETFGSSEAVITGYACACPTPDAPTTPSLIVDPFGGTGTVAGVAKTLGRYGISNDLSESYNRLAVWRITQSGHFTKTEQRSWADRQGQLL